MALEPWELNEESCEWLKQYITDSNTGIFLQLKTGWLQLCDLVFANVEQIKKKYFFYKMSRMFY